MKLKTLVEEKDEKTFPLLLVFRNGKILKLARNLKEYGEQTKYSDNFTGYYVGKRVNPRLLTDLKIKAMNDRFKK